MRSRRGGGLGRGLLRKWTGVAMVCLTVPSPPRSFSVKLRCSRCLR